MGVDKTRFLKTENSSKPDEKFKRRNRREITSMYLTQSGSRENSERNVNHHKNPSTKPDTKSDFRRNIEKSKEEIETIGFITT